MVGGVRGVLVFVVADGLAVVRLGELGGEGDTGRKAEEVGVDVLPPLVGVAASHGDGGVDGEGGAADEGAGPEEAGSCLF